MHHILALGVLLGCFVVVAEPAYAPVQVHPSNPRYFLFRDSPKILVSATEGYFFIYYGNLDFQPFLLDAASHGFNLARLFMLTPNNSLFACLNCSDYMTPWASVDTSTGVQYNLSEWNPTWWNKLHAYLTLASSLGIVVEISLLSQMYALSNWVDCPLYYKNNIQGYGNTQNWWTLNTLDDPNLLGVIDAFITQLITELNPYDNVYFELCNEPPWQTVGKNVTAAFTIHELDLITKLQSNLPYKHMLSFQDASVFQDPRISVYNWHFAFGGSYWTGAIDALNQGYYKMLGTAIAFNEADIVFTGETAEESRVEGWEFIFGGGALYNNLNYEYFSPQGAALHTYLSCLLTFMSKFDFLEVQEDTSFIVSGLSPNVHFRGLVNAGITYAAYFHHATEESNLSHYVLTPGNWQENITVNLVTGSYIIQWIQPSNCSIMSSQMMNANAPFTINSPPYTEDMALLITRF